MTKKNELSEEFFVGYLNDIPVHTKGFLKKIALGLLTFVIVLAPLLSFNQKSFSDANFDFGIFTTLEGSLFLTPFPHLKLTTSSINESCLLVGAGKMGAESALQHFEEKLGPLEGKHVRLKGQLIHGHGKRLMQISKDDVPEIVSNEINVLSSLNFETASLEGEIIDPKCFFGVMKPGEGKPHRSCAIRCISGGIPPVLHTEKNSYILLDENKHPINSEVLGLIGDVVTLKGSVATLDNWQILLLAPEQVKELASVTKQKRMIASMQGDITLCSMKTSCINPVNN
jgi:hypothetical protein